MSSPTLVLILRWMVYVTFRQALASRLFWVMTTATAMCIILCLSVRVSGPPPLPLGPGEVPMRLPAAELAKLSPADRATIDLAESKMSILFGAIRFNYAHYAENAARFLQLLLAGLVADTAGVLLALLWTSGFIPAFLEASSVTVLLAKPVPRWALLIGKYLGVIGFVALQALAFVLGTWIALGLSTGVWAADYLLCVPLLLLHFGIFFSFSACLAVFTRNTVVTMVGSLAFWVLCWFIDYSRNSAQLLALQSGSAGPGLLEAAYWALPKPADLNWLLFSMLQGDKHFGALLDYRTLEARGLLRMDLSVGTSLTFALGLLGLAVWRFRRTDY